MIWTLLAVTALALAVAVVALLVLARSASATRPSARPADDASTERHSSLLSETSDLQRSLRDLAGLETGVTIPDDEVILQRVDDVRAVVIGSDEQARAMGNVVGAAPPLLMRAAHRAGSAAEAGIEAAKETGYLVELSPESARQMRDLRKVKDTAGYYLAQGRDSHGRIRHIPRLRDAARVKTLASGAAIVSAVAAQAQLDEIERQLEALSRDVGGIAHALEDRREAELRGATRLMAEIYRSAREAGVLTEVMWAQLAPMAHTVYTLQEESHLRLRRILHQLQQLSPKAKDRHRELEDVEKRLRQEMRLLLEQERAVAQYQILRVWHLTDQSDPSLEAALNEVATDSLRRRQVVTDLMRSLDAALENPDVQRFFQKRRVFIRRKIRHMAGEVREGLEVELPGQVVLPGVSPDRLEVPEDRPPPADD